MIIYMLDGVEVGCTEMHVPEVTRVVRQGSKAAGGPKAVDHLSGQRLHDLLELQTEFRASPNRIRRRAAALATPPDEESAEAEAESKAKVREILQEVRSRAERGEADFWLEIPDLTPPPGYYYVPFLHTKNFPAAEFVAGTLQQACLRWFYALCDKDAVEEAIKRAPGRKRPWRGTLAALHKIVGEGEEAGAVWEKYVARYRQATGPGGRRGAAPDTPADTLIAWAVSRVGTSRLVSKSGRSKTGVGRKRPSREQLRRELLLEACGLAYALRPEFLPIPLFGKLPVMVADDMDKLYTDVSDQMDGLLPATKDRLQSLYSPEPDPKASRLRFKPEPEAPRQPSGSDPVASLLAGETMALLLGEIARLPPRGRQAIELRAGELSYEEIADLMGCKMQTVKTHLERARKELRSTLGQEPGFEAI